MLDCLLKANLKTTDLLEKFRSICYNLAIGQRHLNVTSKSPPFDEQEKLTQGSSNYRRISRRMLSMNKSLRFSFFLERLTPGAVFSLLLLYTYVELVYVPYLGFNFVLSTGEIPEVFVENSLGPNLERGDHLQQ